MCGARARGAQMALKMRTISKALVSSETAIEENFLWRIPLPTLRRKQLRRDIVGVR